MFRYYYPQVHNENACRVTDNSIAMHEVVTSDTLAGIRTPDLLQQMRRR
jgi:hypothetical protein